MNADGADQAVTGTGVDRAGNSRTATAKVSIDRVAPTITAAVSQASNGGGWNNADVTVIFSCADTLSGVASCPPPVTLTEDGANQEVTGTTQDRAGNSSTASVRVSIDKTKPFIVASRTAANANGWNNTNVVVSYTCSDAVSGILSCSNPATVSTEGASQARTGTAVSHAGLTATTTVDDINIDKTPPTIGATVLGTKNAAGWYLEPPTIHYTCADALSGISTCPAETRVLREGPTSPAPAPPSTRRATRPPPTSPASIPTTQTRR